MYSPGLKSLSFRMAWHFKPPFYLILSVGLFTEAVCSMCRFLLITLWRSITLPLSVENWVTHFVSLKHAAVARNLTSRHCKT